VIRPIIFSVFIFVRPLAFFVCDTGRSFTVIGSTCFVPVIEARIVFSLVKVVLVIYVSKVNDLFAALVLATLYIDGVLEFAGTHVGEGLVQRLGRTRHVYLNRFTFVTHHPDSPLKSTFPRNLA